jgi:hypothetical protein
LNEYRLLVAWEVVEKLNTLPVAVRARLRRALAEIERAPDRCSDFQESNPRGIPLEVHVCGKFVFKYWIDFPDRHVKVLEFGLADR